MGSAPAMTEKIVAMKMANRCQDWAVRPAGHGQIPQHQRQGQAGGAADESVP